MRLALRRRNDRVRQRLCQPGQRSSQLRRLQRRVPQRSGLFEQELRSSMRRWNHAVRHRLRGHSDRFHELWSLLEGVPERSGLFGRSVRNRLPRQHHVVRRNLCRPKLGPGELRQLRSGVRKRPELRHGHVHVSQARGECPHVEFFLGRVVDARTQTLSTDPITLRTSRGTLPDCAQNFLARLLLRSAQPAPRRVSALKAQEPM